jgi:hypothetical protein
MAQYTVFWNLDIKGFADINPRVQMTTFRYWERRFVIMLVPFFSCGAKLRY